MIAKLVVHGKTRTEAITTMLDAIRQYKIEGVATTLPFGTFVFEHDAYVRGNFDTHFVQNYYTPELILERQKANAELAALLALKVYLKEKQKLTTVQHRTTSWKRRLSH
jgi:propionyl-CoA carboxylase alpha chain